MGKAEIMMAVNDEGEVRMEEKRTVDEVVQDKVEINLNIIVKGQT